MGVSKQPSKVQDKKTRGYYSTEKICEGKLKAGAAAELTMFYICQGYCLCQSGETSGVVYCYGDLVPRVGQEEENGGLKEWYGTILTIQLAVWVVGLLAIILLLCLVLRSLFSLEVQLVRLVNLVGAEDENDFIEGDKEEKQPSPV